MKTKLLQSFKRLISHKKGSNVSGMASLLRVAAPVFICTGLLSFGWYQYNLAKSHKSNTGPVTHLTTKPTPKPAKTTPKPTTPAPTQTAPKAATTPAPASSKPKPPAVVVPSPSSSVSNLTPATSTSSSSGSGGSSGSSGSSGGSTQTVTNYYSNNWAGYMSVGGTFTKVSASWVTPPATGNGQSTSADATWIGIGGVTSGDLIQVGTQNTVTASGQVTTSAFYEMLPAASVTAPGITVAPGDHITASVSQIATGSWSIIISDSTSGTSFTTTVAYSSTNSSAEWIEEDPSYGNGQLAPLDNFGTAAFGNGVTVENGSNLTISGSSADSVTMVTYSGQVEATPSALSGGANFTVSHS